MSWRIDTTSVKARIAGPCEDVTIPVDLAAIGDSALATLFFRALQGMPETVAIWRGVLRGRP